MKVLDRIKEWMGRRALVREVRPDRKPVAKNLAASVKVGLIYLVSDEAAHNQVRIYVKKLKEELGLTKIMALGYCEAKVLPHHLHAKLNFDVFSLKDLNWYRIPHGNVVQNFMAEEFDILIDLTVHDLLPLQYILAKSKARFKVGRQSGTNAHFLDMMIDTAGADSLPQLIANLDRYLMMINSPRTATMN
ncbi:MAG: hypothetical protein KBH07_13485 [Flavobacteriales bacterium]|nr:hypothetical protein [Flavobacteriales bacterium]MBP9080637.1 hypothetical protein [Flavobacteriales bacterium]